MKLSQSGLSILIAAALAVAPALAAETSNKWRLEFSGNAESAGNIGVTVMEIGTVVAQVTVPVAKGTAENDVARRVRDELQLKLPRGAYTAESDDGEDVLVKKSMAPHDFQVVISNNTVQGVRIETDRE